MKRTVTLGIILSRVNFGEADRILTVLTPDHGRIRLIAKGVRKVKSKLAGGIELFSVSQITYIIGKSEINTLISTRLKIHYGHIAKDIDRTMFGYEMLKLINKTVEDNADRDYFDMLNRALAGLDDFKLNLNLLRLWFYCKLLKLAGHSPNLKTDTDGNKLNTTKKYNLSPEDMTFSINPQGSYSANHIKLLRLAIGLDSPIDLVKLEDVDNFLTPSLQLSKTMLSQYIKI